MRPRRNSRNHRLAADPRDTYALIVTAFLIAAYLSACAPAPVRRTPRCLIDPAGPAMFCDGEPVPWQHARNVVCHSLDDEAAWMDACR